MEKVNGIKEKDENEETKNLMLAETKKILFKILINFSEILKS